MSVPLIHLSEIQTTDLIYYDRDFHAECLRFCACRDIDCLPSLTDPKKYFTKTGQDFEENDIPLEQIVDSRLSIFEPALLARIYSKKLLFVTTDNILSGVVHFSDYNRPVVHTFLFNLLSEYERGLRRLFRFHGLINQSMVDYFQAKIETTHGDEKNHYRKKFKGYENHKAENEKLTPFECFYLTDLIELARHHSIIEVDLDTCELRNYVMHAHELIHLKDSTQENDQIYTPESFKVFYNRVLVLMLEYKKVTNRIALFKMSQES